MSLKNVLDDELARRSLPEGGFADRPHGRFRADATAWGILVARGSGLEAKVLEKHCARLVQEQKSDGRIPVSPQHPECYWPTALAILAWQACSDSRGAQDLAVRFLLDVTGIHYTKKPDSPSTHDTALRGWPWIENTHSWVEPTAMSVMALRAAGYGAHERVREAVHMLLDRQLPHGGWNAGNTIVFGKELHMMPEGTGAALTSLAGTVKESDVGRSLDYLQAEVKNLRTPISLGWSLIGLAAWGRWPANGGALIDQCFGNQARYREYDTPSLCLLALAAYSSQPNLQVPLFPPHTQRATLAS